MQRKIFIGVNLSNELKKRLMQKVSRFKDAPVRWSEGENLHLDLINLGHIEDEILYDVCDKVKKIVENVDVFDIDIDSIELLNSSQSYTGSKRFFATAKNIQFFFNRLAKIF